MAVVSGANKDDTRKEVLKLLQRIGQLEGIEYGTIKVEYELKFQQGKPTTFTVKDPIEHKFQDFSKL